MRRARDSLSSALNLAGRNFPGAALDSPVDALRLAERKETLATVFLFRVACVSRIVVAVVAVLTVSFVGPYDSSTSILLGRSQPLALDCASNWDGAWFTSLAAHGYVYEQSHAFFPLLPMLMRVTANTLLFWLRPLVSSDEALYSMAGSLMSNLALIWSSVVLYRLGRLVLKDGQLAMRAALLYCFNPASIFFSVSMTEGLFAFLSFSGMLVLESAPVPSFRQRISASALFALATLTRSNGTLLGLHSLWAAHRAYVADASPRRMRRALMELAVVGGLHASALVSVLGFGWAHFCWNKDPRQPWCDWLVPSVYSYVQEHYWNVGPFRYYTWTQAPNFLLAAPAFILGAGGVVMMVRRRAHVYALHLCIALCAAAVVMHVQVVTRFVCASSPAFYWNAARITMKRDGHGSGSGYLLLLYFGFYVVFGTAMFCNFFPWS